MSKVTLQTIAERLGVSRMTVSNAFSRPDQLSAELRQRVLDAADELGYVGPDPSARALAKGTTGAVGVLLTDSLRIAFSDQVATEFLGAIVDELAPTGLALTLLTAGGNAAVVPARDVALDGAIVYSCRTQSVAQDWLVRRRLPVVFVDQKPQPGVASVNVDDRGGARAAAQHVVDLGHRRVGVLNATADGAPEGGEDPHAGVRGYPPRQRMLGWLDALRPAGISPAAVHTRHDTIDEAAQAARSLLEMNPPPTAVLCFSDVLALGVLRAARELGLHVPADVSVVGFDDSPASRDSDPPLTTVRQDVTEKGRLAAMALTEAMEGTRTGRPSRIRHLVLPVELVVRSSTARPNDTAASTSRPSPA